MTTVSVEDLACASETVGDLIAEARPEQGKAPTPCTEWNVREVVLHLVCMDLVFTAMLEGGPMPEREADPLGDDPVGAYRASSAAPRAAFARPEVLERSCRGPLGSATGAERLQMRLHDPLAHGSIREDAGRDPEPTAVVTDAQSLRAAPTVPRSTSGWDGEKKAGGASGTSWWTAWHCCWS
ncbi:maleylpyruvate isomerase N-terminal domain-containing protein [Streptomyces mirabilis]|uniref:maleylpyruvate isomerase N-terminal domain-containing protein n=1 Tax=Streptomyces mirabilis TaxID=68239 RepID=UPI00332350A8